MVEIAHGAGGGLVEQDDGVGSEDVVVDAGAGHAHGEILGGIVGRERADLEAVVNARIERAIAAQGQALAKLGESDEDKGQECRTALEGWPLVTPERTTAYGTGEIIVRDARGNVVFASRET